ncbi:MAG TPA: hypothetical protein VMH83_13310 [Candidatus Acidoferrum sp.]|nr:hypothetical protein [Candidatus Acidoferrum sp.]
MQIKNRFFRLPFSFVAPIAGTGLLLAACWWQPVSAAIAAAATSDKPEKPEVITIIGTQAINEMTFKLYTTQKQMFEVYNQLTSDHDNDVHCDYEVPTGSRIKKWECTPVFVDKDMRRDTRAMIDSLDANSDVTFPRSRQEVIFNNEAKLKRMNAEMLELGRTHPELGDLMASYFAQLQKIAEANQQLRAAFLSKH